MIDVSASLLRVPAPCFGKTVKPLVLCTLRSCRIAVPSDYGRNCEEISSAPMFTLEQLIIIISSAYLVNLR